MKTRKPQGFAGFLLPNEIQENAVTFTVTFSQYNYLSRPLPAVTGIVKHQVKHIVAFLFKQHAVLAFRQIGVQHLLNRRAHLLLGLRILIPILYQHLGMLFQQMMQ